MFPATWCSGAEVSGPAPRVIWKAAYDGPDHGEDRLTGLGLAPDGTAWLSGFSFGETTDFDVATVRVSPDGKTAWTRRYGSPLRCEDRAWCLTRDSAGNVVACGGTITDFSVGWDFLLIKYSASGQPLWQKRFDFHDHSDEKPSCIAVGPDNTLYIAGFTRHRTPVQGIRADGSRVRRADTDIALVKLSPAGDTLWTRLYDGGDRLDDDASSLAVDSLGNCYVLGKVATPRGTDVVLLKYRPDGTRAWAHTIRGRGHSSDLPCAVLLSPSSLVYVAGSFTGEKTSFDYGVACLDTAGKLLWLQTWDAAGRVDVVAAAGLDSSGNIVITGQSTGTASSFDVSTVKYSPAGQLLWQRTFDGPRHAADRGSCLLSLPDGTTLVGATTAGPTGFPDLLIIAYSPSGDTLWTFTHSGTGAGESKPIALGVLRDASGVRRLLVAGTEFNQDTGFDYLLLALSLP